MGSWKYCWAGPWVKEVPVQIIIIIIILKALFIYF